MLALIAALKMFGVLGVVLGPVTIAVTLEIIEMVRQANRLQLSQARISQGKSRARVRRLV